MSSQTPDSSYWQKAYDSLSADLQANFQLSRTGKRDVLRAVLQTAEEKREICLRKRWRVTLPKGQVVIVRDVVEKITRWIQNFVAVGDVAVQYNTASATLPWAAVRFLLLVTINDAQVESSIVSDLETVSRLITRYKEFELIHLQRNSVVRQQMEECLTYLYADILSFLSMANVVKAPSISHSQTILQREAELLKVAGLSDSEKLYYLEESVIRLINRSVAYDKAVDEAKHMKLVQWLSKVPVSAHHTLRSDERMPDSANWLLDHADYRHWKNSSSSEILLLHGIAGSGKSILCSVVVDSYLKTANSQAAPYAFFYCADYQFEPERSQPSEIFRSILKQLTVGHSARPSQLAVRDIILSEFERREAQSQVDGLDMQKLNFQDCVKLIQEVTAVDPVTIIIDALDEIEKFSLPLLVKGLKQIVSNSHNVVKIFLTSRNNSHIFALFDEDIDTSGQPCGHIQKICISREDTLKDMKAYVKCQLSVMKNERHLLRGNVSSKLSEILVDKLVTAAGEMFQWVNIQLRHLCDQTREEDILEILNNAKFTTLDDIYAAVLQRILKKEEVSRDIAVRTFSWLLFMQEAMSSKSLLEIVSKRVLPIGSDFPPSNLIDICSDLVLLDDKRNTFRFSHQSVQEFLRKHELFSADEANFLLATSCLQVCIYGPSKCEAAETVCSDALYRYAAIYWPRHSSHVHKEDHQDLLFTEMLSFIYDDPNDISLSFITWMDQIELITDKLSNDHPLKAAQRAIPNPDYSPLFTASIFGLQRLIEAIAAAPGGQNWDQTNRIGHTSLYLACAFGQASVASTLITYGANVDIQCGRFGGCLQAACFAGHTAVVSLLLAQGVSIRQPGIFNNALQAAFQGRQEDVALLLLQQDSAISNDEEFLDANGSAAQFGFLRVIDRLETSPFTSVHSSPLEKFRTKIAKAVRWGQHGVLATFLNKTPNPIAIIPQESVALAAVYGHDSMIKLLVDVGVDIEHECNFGRPLRCASLMNRESTVRLLITLGANISGLGSHGTALQAASLNGHMRIVKLLLDEGAKVNQQGGVYGTALQAAAYHGHCEIVDLLLESVVSAHNVQGLAKDAFYAARILDKGLLDDKGCEYYGRKPPSPPEACTTINWTRYQLLLRDSSPSRSSLDRGEKSKASKTTDTVYHQYETTYRDILAVAGEVGVRSTAEHSAETSPTIHSESKWTGDGLLTGCAEVGNVRALSAVLERRKHLDIHLGDIIQALEVAAFNGDTVIIHLLLKHMSRPLSVAYGSECLRQAISNCHVSATDLVLEHMDPGGWDEQNLQALVTQACRANVAIAEAVISFARQSTSIEVVSEMVEKAFVQVLTVVDNKFPRKNLGSERGLRTTDRGDANESNGKNKADMIDWLYKQIGNVKQSHSQEAFTLACNRRLQNTAARIIQNAGKNNINRSNILHGITISAYNGSVDLLEYLDNYLSADDERVSYTEPLRVACKYNQLAIVDWLLRRAPKWEGLNTDIIQGLIIASSHGHSRVVHVLLEAGADVNAAAAVNTDDLSGSPGGSQSTQDSDMDSQDYPFITALEASLDCLMGLNSLRKLADKWRIDYYEPLLDHGADVNLQNGRSQLPLQIAAHCGSQRLVRWLIDAGADVAAMADGRDPLIAAAGREESSFEIVQTLLDLGAKVPPEAGYINRLVTASLQCFTTDDDVILGGNEGRFMHTNSLSDVFTKGPGALLRLLLIKTNWKKSYPQFPLVLQMVCVLGDSSYVDLLLERGVDINTVCSYYGTALQAAARHGHTTLVQHLLEAGADPNITGGEHFTVLHAAVKGGHSKVVHALLAFGADVQLRMHPSHGKATENSLLNIAAELGNAEITSMLLNAGIEVVSGREDQQHALVLACGSGSVDTVNRLLEAGANPKIVGVRGSWLKNNYFYKEMTPLHMCCYHGNEEMIQLLLNKSVELEIEIQGSETPLIVAAERGYAGIIRLLVAAGADTTHRSNFHTPLSVAIQRGHLDVVGTLLAVSAPVYDSTSGINAFIYGCKSDSLPVLELLVEAAVSVADGESAILEAIQGWRNWHLHADTVQILLDHGANHHNQSPRIGGMLNAAMLSCVGKWLPKEANPENRVAFSSKWGTDQELSCERIVKILVERGIEITDTPFMFGTSLHLACFMGNESIITILLSKGSDVNSNAGYFKNPLFAAIYRHHQNAVGLLLKNGADPNSHHPEFGSALSYAWGEGAIYIAELLLHHGADPNVRFIHGHSLLIELMMEYHPSTQRISLQKTQMITQILNHGHSLSLCDSDLLAVADSVFKIDGKCSVEMLLEHEPQMIIREETIISLLESS
ncbi:ankyrin repeat-containing domain protein [Xylariaceae sp. AK1471]|nr:ankyrin repeat-containing domain protein [Xylariaceae sp. AK1471]